METVLVIGAARSGIAVSKLLLKNGYHVILTDSNKVNEKSELESLGIEVYDEGHPDCLKEKKYAFIVKNPGIPYRVPFVHYFVEQNAKIYTEIEVAYRYAKNFDYAAVTGTDGKTTVTTLLFEMLNRQKKSLVAGNIGTPLCELALEYTDTNYNVALELSNFQLLGIETFRPHVSTVTNLAPDHLDYMDSLEAYYESKMRIYENTNADDYFIRNVDDENVVKYAQNIPCQVIDFSLKRKDVDLYKDDQYAYYKDTQLFKLSDLKIVGEFNCGNAMMASCMAYLMGVSLFNIQEVIREFSGVEHRIEYVDTVKGVAYYNDSKGTNPDAAIKGIKAMNRPTWLIGGGYDKKSTYDEWIEAFDGKVKELILMGVTAPKIADCAKTHGFDKIKFVDSMEEAVSYIAGKAQDGEAVLLSPACASWGMFPNYEVRGDIFKDCVRKLKEN